MRVTLLLADAAQVVDNKLYILGGGWSITGPDPTPFAIAMKIEVPWTEANKKHRWELRLLGADGEQIRLEGLPDQAPIEISGDFEVGRPPGITPGVALEVALAINSTPLPLPPGQRFVWQLWIDGETQDDWTLSFATRGKT